jgi:hypothetical protein
LSEIENSHNIIARAGDSVFMRSRVPSRAISSRLIEFTNQPLGESDLVGRSAYRHSTFRGVDEDLRGARDDADNRRDFLKVSGLLSVRNMENCTLLGGRPPGGRHRCEGGKYASNYLTAHVSSFGYLTRLAVGPCIDLYRCVRGAARLLFSMEKRRYQNWHAAQPTPGPVSATPHVSNHQEGVPKLGLPRFPRQLRQHVPEQFANLFQIFAAMRSIANNAVSIDDHVQRNRQLYTLHAAENLPEKVTLAETPDDLGKGKRFFSDNLFGGGSALWLVHIDADD